MATRTYVIFITTPPPFWRSLSRDLPNGRLFRHLVTPKPVSGTYRFREIPKQQLCVLRRRPRPLSLVLRARIQKRVWARMVLPLGLNRLGRLE